MSTYFLTTSRLQFRTWREDDAELAKILWGDPRVTHFIDSRASLSEDEVTEKLAEQLQTQRAHGIQYWPMFLTDTGQFIGCAGLRPKDVDKGILEFGVHLISDYWGRGLAVEAGRAVILYAFQRAGAEKVFAGHNPNNKASEKMISKLGFVRIDDEFYPSTGLMHPSYIWDKSLFESLGS